MTALSTPLPPPSDGAMRTVIGLMSGTSGDGIDVAVLRTDGVGVVGWGPYRTVGYDPPLRRELLAALADPAGDLTGLEHRLTQAHAAAVRAFLAGTGTDPRDIDLIGFHGQTVQHAPHQRLTRQLGDGAALARALHLPVVFDFRTADVAAGGQGAPLAPLYHAALAHGSTGTDPIAILNIGGVTNLTFLDGATVLACDVGPGNAPLDDWVRRTAGLPYDRDGTVSAAGRPHTGLIETWLRHPFYGRPPPKSLDRNQLTPAMPPGLSAPDGAATLAHLIAAAVARAVGVLPARPAAWWVTGGGRHNPTVMAALARVLGAPVAPVEQLGWAGDALEAQAFAFLAVRSVRGLPLSLPTTTAVPRPMTGGRLADPGPAP